MSVEKITINKKESLASLVTPKVNIISSGRVDINDLLARVRRKKEKENKINLVFSGLICTLILVVGIILSF